MSADQAGHTDGGVDAEDGAPATHGDGGRRRQSVAGIMSCGLFALVAALVFVFRVIKPGEDVTGPAEGTVHLLQLVSVRVAFYALVLGVMLGLGGLVQRSRRRHLAAAGLLLNGLPLLAGIVSALHRALGL